MGIKDLNWLNNSYNKNNNTGGGNTGGGSSNIDTSNFVKKQEFYSSQNEQDNKINEAKTTIDAIKQDPYHNTNMQQYVYSKNWTDQVIGEMEISIEKQFDEKLAEKQNNLTAGNGIEIKNNIISLSAALAGPDMSQYYTKPETNNLISPINTRVDEAYGKIRENNTAITGLQDQNKTLQQSITQNQTQIAQNTADILDLKNKPGADLSNYYTKAELSNNSTTLKPRRILLGEGLEINRYGNNELILYATEKITLITTKNGDKRIELLADGTIRTTKPLLIKMWNKDSKFGCSTWEDFKYKLGDCYDENGNLIDMDNTANVSNNIGGIDGFSRGYQIFKDFYKKVKQ